MFSSSLHKSFLESALASWRGERTASVGLREDGWVDFGASAKRNDGKQDGGDALELIVRVNDEPKPEMMRALARQLVREARAALEEAADCGEQPPQWVQAFMSPAGWERYRHLCKEAGYPDDTPPAITEPAPHTGGELVCIPLTRAPRRSHTHTGQRQRQRREAAQAGPLETHRPGEPVEACVAEPVGMHELEVMRDYGRAQEWAALVIDGEEINPAGCADWLRFVWLSSEEGQQRRVYGFIRGKCSTSE